MKLLTLTMVLLCGFGLSLSSCKSKQNQGTERVAGVPEDFQLVIYHQGCRGSCPDYKITVDATGTAVYEGRRAVEMLGTYKKVLDADVVRDLHKTLKKYNYFELEEVYGGGVADLPELHITATMDGNTKKMVDIRYAPVEVKEMEARLETLIGMDDWERTSAP